LAVGLFVVATAPTARAQSGLLLGNPQVAPLGLETMWSAHVRVDAARGRVKSVQLTHGVLLAQTDQGVVQAFDPETGRSLWIASVGSPTAPTMAPSANEKFVAVTNGTTLYLLDRTNGSIVWESRCGGSPCSGSGMGETRVYVPLDGGIVESYLLVREKGVDKIPKRSSGAGGAIAAPIVVGKRASWSVAPGFVYSNEDVYEGLSQFRFRVDDDLSAAPTWMDPYLFVASRRGTVYALDDKLGSEIWRFSVGSSVSQAPIAIDGALYVINETHDVVRLDPRYGRQLWAARGVDRFVAQSVGRAYLVDMSQRLQARDAKTGLLIGAISARGFDLPSVNLETDRIYLASQYGMIQCLRETSLGKPIMHTPGFAVPPPPKPGAPAGATDPNAAPADPNAAPAAGGAANPFGAAPN
jgi:hypothetical protein